MEHVLERDLVLQFDNWADLNRGAATNTRRKVMDHMCCLSRFVLVQFPGLAAAYCDVPDLYRRMVNQLRVIEGQETKSQSDLIRDKNWLPFPVLVALGKPSILAASGRKQRVNGRVRKVGNGSGAVDACVQIFVEDDRVDVVGACLV